MPRTIEQVSNEKAVEIGPHEHSGENLRQVPEYSVWGWIVLSIGLSVAPKKLKYYCKKCGEFVYESTDKAELDAYQDW